MSVIKKDGDVMLLYSSRARRRSAILASLSSRETSGNSATAESSF